MVDEPTSRLDGWKAIADYLGRDLRTAQRWRKERGMPVHRVPGVHGGSVFAYRAELDAWLLSEAGAETPPAAVPDSPREPKAERQGLPAADAELVGVSPSGGAPPTLQRPARRRLAWVLALAGLATITGALILINTGSLRSISQPAGLRLDGTTLTALDVDRSPLWSFSLADRSTGGSKGRTVVLDNSLMVDLDGDGRDEMVALIAYNDSDRRSVEDAQVYCFSPEGRLLWTYRPAFRFIFGGREFAGPWRPRAATAGTGRNRRVWVSFIHRIWWPSFVVSLGQAGDARLALVNAGHIESLRTLERGDRTLILAGGYNNEYRTTALAIFEEQPGAVTSPQTDGSPYACEGCSAEPPWRYLLLPRSELNRTLGDPYPQVSPIESPDDTGVVEISVREHVPPEDVVVLRTLYRFAADLSPLSVAASDAYWGLHRRFSDERRIQHFPDECPQRTRGVSLRMFEAGKGWTDMQVPPRFAQAAAPGGGTGGN